MAVPSIADVVREFRFAQPRGTRLFVIGGEATLTSAFLASLDWLTAILWQFETVEPYPLDPREAPEQMKSLTAEMVNVAKTDLADRRDMFGPLQTRVVEVAELLMGNLERGLGFEQWAVRTMVEWSGYSTDVRYLEPGREARLRLLAEYGRRELIQEIGADAGSRMLRAGLDQTRDRFWMVVSLPRDQLETEFWIQQGFDGPRE